MPFRCHSSDKRHDELLDADYNRLERNGLDVELVLPDEGSPLALLGFVLKERSRERSWREVLDSLASRPANGELLTENTMPMVGSSI